VDDFIDESMTEMYIYEVSEMLTKIEQILIDSDLEGNLSVENILVLFRLMHSLKSSARAMGYKVSSKLAHKVEDLLKYVEKSNKAMENFSTISDISLSCVDYFRLHIHKIKRKEEGEDDANYLFERIDNYFESLSNEGNQDSESNEDINASTDDDNALEVESLKEQKITFQTSSNATLDAISSSKKPATKKSIDNIGLEESYKDNKLSQPSKKNIDSIISVKMDKLDLLMNLVGEMVIAEPLVTESKEIDMNKTVQFSRDAARLHKMIIELQNIVMSIRMVTLSSTMVKINRILHDMNKQFNKSVELEVVGEDTEVDKNVIDLISDPLMHILRNALDHGIESEEERTKLGKSPNGKIIIEARNIGSNVLISVSDDGRGMDTLAIYEKAKKLGLIDKPYDSMSDQELFNLTLIAGFTTNSEVTDYSGRGVGMDVVQKNIQLLSGTINIYSEKNVGTTMVLKIPLLLSIVEAMNIRINKTLFTIPIDNIVETFRARRSDFVIGPNDDKLIKVRENLYPLLSLNKVFNLETKEMDMNRGVFIVASTEGETFCIYCDEIIGQYSVVAKAIPDYLQKYKEIDGIAGCTIMRDGQISLILDCYAIIKIVKHISGVKSAKK
jgi:two-component system chemotaxis sensor kinase CheA